VAGIDRRIEALERLIQTPEDEGAAVRQALMRDILGEFGRLRACRANSSYRGGTPPTPVQPTDPAGEALGYPYTTGECVEYAIRRVLERERDAAPDILTEEAVDQLAASWTMGLRSFFGERWDEVEDEGPPEPARPWRGGF
jgi:hypothetical protein